MFLEGLDLVVFDVFGFEEFVVEDRLASVVCVDGFELLLHLTHDWVVL
jgi:hypothetical protein